ncbi:zinc finger and SCAN domain-containing protein 2 [Pleuronectes platessa]|uniref:zinc finger and SCAN domain-containing protein 2 n=1 Tax=Pleuronectes platessa TaxID=8262 RepID=UPI00232A79AA|nr:zinc finger and SCAN domain-containing protein 2 [Pleuronectes platessa]XP_053274547.1 zinc finger and SCAN domain-containing protein 2 [Pleuronectes platessa]
MKPQLTGTKRRSPATQAAGDEAALSLEEELVAAIHAAFEVAVQIAVSEVKKLVGQATGDTYEDVRRENESLRRRLQRAEAMLEPACVLERSGVSLSSTDHPSPAKFRPAAVGVHSCRGIPGEAPPACHSCAQQPENRREEKISADVRLQLVSHAALEPEEELSKACTSEVTQTISHVSVVKAESVKQPCQETSAHHVAPLPSSDAMSSLEQITVKQEKHEQEEEEEEEEDRDSLDCCLDSIKVEDFSLESVSEWEQEVLDPPSQDLKPQLSCTTAQAHPPNMTPGLPPPTDLLSLSSEFPIFQLEEPAPTPELIPQTYGVHVRSSHTTSNMYSCKLCGQTFHLPSLLRRHSGQCQPKHQQRCPPPTAGRKRSRLQLYPPGCSPFRCTECNRDFNRLENLKTHLRIHTGERPFTCSVCSKCFRHSGALTRHFRIHTGEKPYVCGQCGKSFRNCGGLKFHQRAHSKQLQ